VDFTLAKVDFIEQGSFRFPRHSGSGPQTQTRHHGPYYKNVRNAYAVISGQEFGFSPYDDRNLGRVTLKVEASPLGNTVHVESTFGVRDWSGNWDDDYEGRIDYTVFIELEGGIILNSSVESRK
jgi:hypothetical protein